ncbi:MAG TPA: TRAP transporter substrate-binding protein [Burkholderiales bacterium]
MRRPSIKGAILAGILAGAALAAAGAPALARDKAVHLKLAHWVPAKHPIHPSLVAWGESITKASNGTITFSYFPAQQLGPAKDHYAMTESGITDLSFINPGYTPGQFPVVAAGELPFLITNAKAGSRAFDEWYRRHNAKEMRNVHYCLAFLHDPGTFHSREPIVSPAQVKGLKVRPAHATMARFVNLLGGASVQVSAPEARDAIAKGTADALTFPWNSVVLFGIDNVTRHHLDMPLYVTTFVMPMNKAKYESLSPAQKKVIDAHCTPEWAEKLATPWAEWEAAGREAMAKKAGHTLHRPSAADVQAWRKAAEPLQAAWAEDVKRAGQDPKAIFDDLIETLRKHKSLYEGH